MAATERRDNEALESEESAVECDLARAEETHNETTKVSFEDFAPTMTVSGLQLVQDAKQACRRGDKDACRRVQVIRRFLERAREERRDISATLFRQKGEPFLVQKQVSVPWH